jgi:hypothetical protein
LGDADHAGGGTVWRSDKAVETRCKRLGVPKPPRGYWAKLAAGQIDPELQTSRRISA